MSKNIELNTENISIGVVGLGLMGCSIVACLLNAGHKVIAVAPINQDMLTAKPRILNHLNELKNQNILNQSLEEILFNLTISEDYKFLLPCSLVIECTIETLEIKKSVFSKIEAVVTKSVAIGSNTSAIPISILQEGTQNPERFLGLHWAEPAYLTRFLEIICGDKTDIKIAEYFYELAHKWAKEPTLVRKDIRGFITNRLNYAMYREAIYLVENGYATVEDVDRVYRNNNGSWATLIGPFRFMDLTGVPAYHNVMKDLWPTLSNATEVPKLIQEIVNRGGKGTANADGFYKYTEAEAKAWEDTFSKFSFEIREMALKYPHDVVKTKLEKYSENE